jgi:hypothetical protein
MGGRKETKCRVSRLDFAGGVVSLPCGLTVTAESSPDAARLISKRVRLIGQGGPKYASC